MRYLTPDKNIFRGLGAVLAGACTLLLTSCATTGFNKADTDASGVVSVEEFERYLLDTVYSEADSNGDAKLTFAEWKAAYPSAEKRKFRQPDTNGNGGITRAEAKAHFERTGVIEDLFRRIDTDKTGSVTVAEIDAFLDKMRAKS